MSIENTFVLEGEEIIRELERRIPAIVWEDFATLTTAGVEMYINGSSVSATWLSGTSLVTGNVQTCPTITVPTGAGGLTAVLEAAVIANSQTWKTGVVYRILKPGAQK